VGKSILEAEGQEAQNSTPKVPKTGTSLETRGGVKNFHCIYTQDIWEEYEEAGRNTKTCIGKVSQKKNI